MNKLTREQLNKLAVQYMNTEGFGEDWRRTPDSNDEFICYGKGNRIDAVFTIDQETTGEVTGVIHPGSGRFKIVI